MSQKEDNFYIKKPGSSDAEVDEQRQAVIREQIVGRDISIKDEYFNEISHRIVDYKQQVEEYFAPLTKDFKSLQKEVANFNLPDGLSPPTLDGLPKLPAMDPGVLIQPMLEALGMFGDISTSVTSADFMGKISSLGETILSTRGIVENAGNLLDQAWESEAKPAAVNKFQNLSSDSKKSENDNTKIESSVKQAIQTVAVGRQQITGEIENFISTSVAYLAETVANPAALSSMINSALSTLQRIEQIIEQTRQELSSNAQQLDNKVESRGRGKTQVNSKGKTKKEGSKNQVSIPQKARGAHRQPASSNQQQTSLNAKAAKNIPTVLASAEQVAKPLVKSGFDVASSLVEVPTKIVGNTSSTIAKEGSKLLKGSLSDKEKPTTAATFNTKNSSASSPPQNSHSSVDDSPDKVKFQTTQNKAKVHLSSSVNEPEGPITNSSDKGKDIYDNNKKSPGDNFKDNPTSKITSNFNRRLPNGVLPSSGFSSTGVNSSNKHSTHTTSDYLINGENGRKLIRTDEKLIDHLFDNGEESSNEELNLDGKHPPRDEK